MFRRWILPKLVYWFYRIWVSTWKVSVEETPELTALLARKVPIIFAHWHRDELSIVHLVRPYRIATMTSTSKDGQLIDYVVRSFGGATSKGSSTRGGSTALIGLTKLVKDGYNASMAVDGPKGPIYKVKPGVFELSKLSGAWIAPLGVASSKSFVFAKSWNKARLPKPFAKVVVRFGTLKRIDGNPKQLIFAEELANEIMHTCAQAESRLHGSAPANPER